MARTEPQSGDSEDERTSSSASSTTTIHVTALDAIVNVNALFTVAVFIGLSLTTPEARNSDSDSSCVVGPDHVRKQLVYEVVSFSFFLFSSLIAQGLKLAVNLLTSKYIKEAIRAHINFKVLRFGIVASGVGSVMGCLFLMLSIVTVVEVKLGKLSCGGDSVYAVVTLVILVSSALVVFISTAIYGFVQFYEKNIFSGLCQPRGTTTSIV